MILCSVTAGSDIGLLGRGSETESSKDWRVWSIEDENRRATVPYNMEKNEETIVVGMHLDFTATKKLEKPLYPDEDPLECESLPILWVLNTSGQLAGWTVMYIPGIKAGERPVSMMPIETQDEYWQKKKEERLKEAEQVDEGEQRDRILWEKEWQEASSTKQLSPVAAQRTPENPSRPPSQPGQTAVQTPNKATLVQSSPISTIPSQPTLSTNQASHPAFGKPSQLGAPTFGSQVFGPGRSTSGSMGGGFAKYSSSQLSQGSSFLSGQSSQTGSFLQNSKGGSFLQGGQTSSFLQAGQDQGFGKYAAGRGFETSQSMTTPSSFSEGGFLANKPASSPSSPFGSSPKGSLSQRTQSLTSPSSRTQSYDMLNDTDSDDSKVDESESDEDNSVRVDALNFGESGFNLDLDTQSQKPDTKAEEPITPVRKDSSKEGINRTISSPSTMESPSSVADKEYVRVGIPITPSPRSEKSMSTVEEVKDFTPSGREKSQITDESPVPASQASKEPSVPNDKATPTIIHSKPTAPLVVEKAITPPAPFSPQLPSQPTTKLPPISFFSPPSTIPPVWTKDTIRTVSPDRSKVELRQFVPVSGTADISSRLSDSTV